MSVAVKTPKGAPIIMVIDIRRDRLTSIPWLTKMVGTHCVIV